MTTPEIITDAILDKAYQAYITDYKGDCEGVRRALLAAQDDMARPVYNILNGWKREAQAYEFALKVIRANKSIDAQEIADLALKGDYHSKRVENDNTPSI